MSFFSLFRKKKTVQGLISYYDLNDWWETLNDDERQYMCNQADKGMGGGSKELTEGSITFVSISKLNYLSSLLANGIDKDLASNIKTLEKIIDKCEQSFHESPVIDQHLYLSTLITLYYKLRESEDYLLKAMETCKRQINLSKEAAKQFKKEFGTPLPSHKGYYQLSIVLTKQKEFKDALNVVEQAKEDGWSGDWDKRIERLKNKLV